ncbi:MAG: zf-HC2 domain-containing protein [Anaerolineae bacterium]|nr:MAG: zf-HC2 domain-containing protein [Anaerolineae bacterium]
MEHRPFEDWLLEERPLTPEQRRRLQAHLRVCADCAALAEVGEALRRGEAVAPAPGFVDRFRMRLARERARQRRRGVLGISLLAAGVLGPGLVLLWPYLMTAIRSPAALLALWVHSLAFLISLGQAIGRAGLILLQVFSGFVPPASGLLLISAATGLILLWVFSLWRISSPPQSI